MQPKLKVYKYYLLARKRKKHGLAAVFKTRDPAGEPRVGPSAWMSARWGGSSSRVDSKKLRGPHKTAYLVKVHRSYFPKLLDLPESDH